MHFSMNYKDEIFLSFVKSNFRDCRSCSLCIQRTITKKDCLLFYRNQFRYLRYGVKGKNIKKLFGYN